MKNTVKRIFTGIIAITKDRAGYNLIELVIVIAIIAVLAGIAAPKFLSYLDSSKVQAAKSDMSTMSLSLDKYKMDSNSYPTEEQGLKALFEKPETDPIPENYPPGGYMKKSGKPGIDPWGNPYTYKCPGSDDSPYDIICLGADGKEGGKDYNADIVVKGN